MYYKQSIVDLTGKLDIVYTFVITHNKTAWSVIPWVKCKP